MQDYDTRFLEFSNKLEKSHHLFGFRDILFNSFAYQMTGWKPLLRHRYGIVSWFAWAMIKAKAYRCNKQILSDLLNHNTTLDMMDAGHVAAHWMNLRPLAESAINSGHTVRLWFYGYPENKQDVIWNKCNKFNVYDYVKEKRISISLIIKALALSLKISKICGFPLCGKITSQMADVMLTYWIWHDVWKEIFHDIGCQIAVVTSEGSPHTKAFVYGAKSERSSIWHICHGLPFELHTVTNATDIFSFSVVDAKWFRHRISTNTRIHSLGNPRISQIRIDVLKITKKQVHSPLRILFLSNGVEYPYTFQHEAQDLSILRLAPEISKMTVLRVRPHPRESREILESSLKTNNLQYEMITNGSLADDLAWADVCATPWSTSLLEAIVCELPCFWMNARNDRMVRTGDYIDTGIGTLVTDSHQWEAIILSILDDPSNAERYRLRRIRLEEVGLIPPNDGLDWFDRYSIAANLA